MYSRPTLVYLSNKMLPYHTVNTSNTFCFMILIDSCVLNIASNNHCVLIVSLLFIAVSENIVNNHYAKAVLY